MKRGNVQRIARGSYVWRHLHHARQKDLHAVAQELHLSEAHEEVLRTASHRSRLFVTKSYLLLALAHPIYDAQTDNVLLHELDVLLTPTQTISLQRAPFPVLDACLIEAQRITTKQHLAPPVVMATVLIHLTADLYATLGLLAERIDAIEERVLDNSPSILQEIVNVQTNIIDIQKSLESRIPLIDRLFGSLKPSVQTTARAHYDELRRHTQEVQESIAIEYQTIQALHRAHETYLNTRTNRLIHVLTAVTIIVMPATLLAGIFGMNTQYPWILGIPYDFTLIIGIMSVSGVVLWSLLKKHH